MQNIIQKGRLLIPLYHGTSTVFVNGISQHGLGGRNPVKDWNLLCLAGEVLALSKAHLQDTPLYKARSEAFAKMTKQETGIWNWQHGDTYLSPAKSTAIRYAIGKRFGSELLTYTVDFLEELYRREVPGVKDDLFRRYPDVFGIMEACPSPILIEASNIPIKSLQSEDGSNPDSNFNHMNDVLLDGDDSKELLLQQTNFRLTEPVPTEDLRFWLINVLQWNPWKPTYKLYELTVS